MKKDQAKRPLPRGHRSILDRDGLKATYPLDKALAEFEVLLAARQASLARLRAEPPGLLSNSERG